MFILLEVMLLLPERIFLLPECIFLLPEHIFLLTECLMGHLMDPIMGRSMDRVLHLMGAGINNPLTLQITALYIQIVKVHHTMVLPCHPIRVKREEGTMAKAMVVIKPIRERSINLIILGSLSS